MMGRIKRKNTRIIQQNNVFVKIFMYLVKIFRMLSLTAVLFTCLLELGVFASVYMSLIALILMISYMYFSWENLKNINYNYFYELLMFWDTKNIDYTFVCALLFCLVSALCFHIEILYIFLPFVALYNFYLIDYAIAFSCIFSHVIIMYNYAYKNIKDVLKHNFELEALLIPFGFTQLIFIISCCVYPSSLLVYVLFYLFIGMDLGLKLKKLYGYKVDTPDEDWARHFIYYFLLNLFVVILNLVLVNDLLFSIIVINVINLVSLLDAINIYHNKDDVFSSLENLMSYFDNLCYFLGYYFFNKVLLIFHACMDSVLPVLFMSIYFPQALVLAFYPVMVMSNMFYMRAKVSDLSIIDILDYKEDQEGKEFRPYLGFIFSLSFIVIFVSFSILEAVLLLAFISLLNYLIKNYDYKNISNVSFLSYIFKTLDIFMHVHESLHIMEHLNSFFLIKDEIIAGLSFVSSFSLISKGNCCGGSCDYNQITDEDNLFCQPTNT